MNFQKLLPVATSIAIIIVVAVLREKSRTLAAIFGTMPINMPFAMWLVSSSTTNEQTQPLMINFTGSLITGLITSVAWLLVVYVLLRLGFGLIASILGGYVMWAVLLALAFWFGFLKL